DYSHISPTSRSHPWLRPRTLKGWRRQRQCLTSRSQPHHVRRTPTMGTTNIVSQAAIERNYVSNQSPNAHLAVMTPAILLQTVNVQNATNRLSSRRTILQ